MAGTSIFGNLARAAKIVALLLFFLPWVAVSCSPDAMQQMQNAERGASAPAPGPRLNAGITIATASGLNMALGTVSMTTPPRGLDPSGGAAKQNAEPPQVPIEIGVIAGAAVLLLALIASFLLKGSAAAIAGIGGSVLAIVAFCYSVFVSYPPAVIAAFVAGNGRGGEAANLGADQLAQILSVKPEASFWFVLIMLVLAVVFNVMALRKPAAVAAPAATPPPVA
jgi:hypothetical protein